MINNRAFTLIELLVVVLIIGILAAVALPQYKTAVGKARLTQLLTLSKSVKDAQEVYFLANSRYTNDWAELPLSLQGTTTGAVLRGNEGWTLELRLSSDAPEINGIYATDSRLPGLLLIVGYQYASPDGGYWNNRRSCYAVKTNSDANILCQRVANTKHALNSGQHWRYDF
ncbi:MAG: prepilin-type N-terminal cleavage/methylation domain-containing protein [Elusimicrobiaceae bacterium]|nr:prepilin-type N-terminal cleavage/methylation domain-containing protein [Elusimicrobiaceae bacterium]